MGSTKLRMPRVAGLPLLVVGFLALCVTGRGLAQSQPSNGYVGIFGDLARTTCCVEIPPGEVKYLEVFAILGGETAGGITQAEFRLVFTVFGYFTNWIADPNAAVVIGSPLHSDFQNPNWGVNIAFSSCQGSMAGDAVHLGSVATFSNHGPPSDILVTRRLPPTDPNHDCPNLVLCDVPVYTQVCLTAQTPPSGPEPIIFKAGLNRGSACDPSRCAVVALTVNTWSRMKNLYR